MRVRERMLEKSFVRPNTKSLPHAVVIALCPLAVARSRGMGCVSRV
jgi:hypothetical protein